jgi:hypothetical protein
MANAIGSNGKTHFPSCYGVLAEWLPLAGIVKTKFPQYIGWHLPALPSMEDSN